MRSAKEIEHGLRCIITETGRKCQKRECPYFYIAPEEERKAFVEAIGNKGVKEEAMNIPEDFWETCDMDQIAADAAELIGQLREAGVLA